KLENSNGEAEKPQPEKKESVPAPKPEKVEKYVLISAMPREGARYEPETIRALNGALHAKFYTNIYYPQKVSRYQRIIEATLQNAERQPLTPIHETQIEG